MTRKEKPERGRNTANVPWYRKPQHHGRVKTQLPWPRQMQRSELTYDSNRLSTKMGLCGYVATAASTEKKLQEAQGGEHLTGRGDQTLRPGAETEAEEGSTAGQAAAGLTADGHPTTRRRRAHRVRSRAHRSRGRHERGPQSRNGMNVLCPRVRRVSEPKGKKVTSTCTSNWLIRLTRLLLFLIS